MKLLTVLSLFSFSLFFLVGCGSENCDQSLWLGTYQLDESVSSCSDPSVTLNETIVITAGSTETSIRIDGDEEELDGCEVTSFGIAKIKLNGDQLEVSGLGCEGVYDRI